jgi:hypothetical protein
MVAAPLRKIAGAALATPGAADIRWKAVIHKERFMTSPVPGLQAHQTPDPGPGPIGDPSPMPVGDPPLPISPDPVPQPDPGPDQIPPPPPMPG